MDRVERRIAAERLHPMGSLGFHVLHELYLVAHHQRDGLTDKEYAYLMRRYENIKKELEYLTPLTQRLQHGKSK